jgi:type VI secretion system protein ImpH
MTVAFMGLFGSQGMMPVWYTERIIARKAVRDGVLEAFFNLFNHRFISLFYRAWEKHRPPVQYELAALRGIEPDPFTACLYDLVGMGTAGLRGRLKIADQTLLLYGGLIAQRPRSATAVKCILRDYFRVPVGVEQFVGSWYEFEDTDRAWLSAGLERNQLGIGAFIGRRVWDQQARIRIRLGPLSLERFKEFLPGGAAMRRLTELTRFLIGPSLAFEVQPVLRAGEVPGCRLSPDGADAPRLGRMAWLKTRPFCSHADHAVFAYVR